MASAIGKVVAKKGAQMVARKALNKQLNDNKGRDPAGQWDPYYEWRPDRKGRLRKFKKQIPDYIPPHDAEILAKVRKWAYRLDVKLSLLGMRFGWSTVIGAIPEVGDIIDVLLALYIYQQCRRVGLDTKTKHKMKMWILVDGLVGVVPVVGDLVDASIKCNARNCRLLEEFLDKKYKEKPLKALEQRLERDDTHYLPPAPATVYEDFSDSDLHEYSSRDHSPERETYHRQHSSLAHGANDRRVDVARSNRNKNDSRKRR